MPFVRGYKAVGIRAVIAPNDSRHPFVTGLPGMYAAHEPSSEQASDILAMMASSLVKAFRPARKPEFTSGMGPTGFQPLL